MNKRIFVFFAALFCHCFSYAQKTQTKSDFEAALFYFRANKPHDAIELFEAALENPDVEKSAYVYLGVSYFQIGEYQRAFDVCKKGLTVSGTDKKILALNAGNAAFAMGSYAAAEEYYRRALLEDGNYIPAVLNLSNTLVEEGKYSEAIGFYEKFLTIADEDNPQRPNVEEILRKLKVELEKHKDTTPQLVSIDDVEYLNRLDAEEERLRKQKVAFEKVNSDYFLKEKDDGIYIVKSERYIDDYKEEVEYKIEEAELYVDAQKFEEWREKNDLEKIEFEKIEIESLKDEKPDSKPIKIVEDNSEKLGEEYYILKIEDKKVTIEKTTGEKIIEKDLALEKFDADEFFESIEIEKGGVKVLDEMGDVFDIKIEDEELLPKVELPPPPPAPLPKISLNIEEDDFTPDGDGINDIAKIRVIPKNADYGKVASWELLILDVKGGVLKRFSGGSEIPDMVEFDGQCDGDMELTSATDYPVKIHVTMKDGEVLEADSILSTGILVLQDGDKYKIKVPNINFDPNAASMDSLTAEQLASNEKILTMVAFALKKFQEYRVTVEGHANNTTGTEEEERKELIPLSRARAKAVMQILIEKGIERSRLTAVGMGGKKPIASGADSWKNRRVEFILEK